MPKLPTFKKWKNNEILTAKDYVYEREAIATEVDDQDDRLESLEDIDSGTRLNSAEEELERLETAKLDRDGSKPMTGNLNLANNDIVGAKNVITQDVELPNHPEVNTRLTSLQNDKLNRSGSPAMTGNLQMGNNQMLGASNVSTTNLQVSNDASVSETLTVKQINNTQDINVPTHGSVVSKLTQLQDEKVDKNLINYSNATLGEGTGNLQRIFVDDAGDAKQVNLDQLRAYIAEDFTSFGFVLASADQDGLPDISISERLDNKIYLVATQSPKGPDDIYNEYLWLNGSWEFIGNTDVDLVNYFTKNEINDKLNAATISYNPDTVSFGAGVNTTQAALEQARLLIGSSDEVVSTYYVAINGDDNNSGSKNNPFRTIKHACNVISQLDPVQGPFGPTAPLSAIRIDSGRYFEQLPIVVPPNTALIGNDLRTVQVYPASGLSDDEVTPNNQSQMFQMSAGTLAMFIALYGMTGWVKPTNINDDPSTIPAKGVGFALNPASPIFGPSPYILDCSSFFPGGIGAYVDGDVHVVNGTVLGNRSMLFYAFTNINDEGVGFWADNGGIMESVSNFTYYAAYGYLATRGGYLRALNGSNSWGTWALYARGFLPSETPITGEIKGTMIEYRDADGPFQVGTTLTGQTSGAIATVLNIQEANQNLFIQRTSTEVFIEDEAIVASNGTNAVISVNEFGQKGALLVLSNLSGLPEIRESISIAGDSLTYVVASVSGTYIDQNSIIVVTLAQNKPDSSAPGSAVELRKRYSQIRVTGHDFLNVGAGGIASITIGGGTLINPGTPPVQSQQVGEFNTGRVFSVSTDQDGNFRVGKFFSIDQGTGRATLDASAFDLSGLSSLRLGSIGAQLGESINEFSADPLLSQNSNEKVPTQAAVRTYVNTEIDDAVNPILNQALPLKADLVNGKIPVNQLPLEAVVFRGTFGSENSTTGGDLPSENQVSGDLYIADVNYSSTVASILFKAGDKALWDGSSWKKNEGVMEFASEGEAQQGTDNTKTMTPLRTQEGITARLADTQEAETGTDTTKLMTPKTTKDAILEIAPEVYSAGVTEINNNEDIKFWRGTQAEFDIITPQLVTTYTSPSFTESVQFPTTFETTIPYTPIAFDGNFNNNFAKYISNLKFYVTFDGETEPILFYDGAEQSAGSFENVISAGWIFLSATFGSVPDLSFNGAYDSEVNVIDFIANFGFNSQTDQSGNFLYLTATPNISTYTPFTITVEQYVSDHDIEYLITDESIDFATEQEAQTGTDETKFMNPLRTKQAIEALSPPPTVLEVTIPTTGWTGTDPSVRVLTVSGLLPTDNPIIDIKLENEPFANWEDIETAWSLVKAADSGTNQITFYATGVPEIAIPIRIKIVR